MRPRRIYIVGTDCSGKGHCECVKSSETSVEVDFSYLIKPWKKLKDFAMDYYPDVEVISVNPVGLKGLFTDYYTE